MYANVHHDGDGGGKVSRKRAGGWCESGGEIPARITPE